jgi:hypothetical protein
MEVIRSSETSVLTITTGHQIPEDDSFHVLRGFENRVQRGIFGPRRMKSYEL